MSKFIENWNYKKHAVAISSIYLGISIVGNAFLGKKISKDERSINPIVNCKQMTKKQWIFNGIIAGMYSVDMSLTYCIINHFKKQFK